MSTAAPGSTSPGPFSARRRPFDVVPLSEMRGPATGVITLPRHVRWSGTARSYEVTDPVARRTAYKHLLEEGLADDLRRYLNAGLLVADLPYLVLRPEVRAAWQRTVDAATTPRR
jgi:hypothetical protein